MSSFKSALVFAFARSVPALPELARRTVALVALALILLACSPPPPPVAAVDAACSASPAGPLPALPATESSPEQLALNAQAALERYEAAVVVASWDDSFSPLAQALGSLSKLASSLTPPATLSAIPREDWDFAKYVQAVAADQCAQLYRITG